jgi:hypothetical protein
MEEEEEERVVIREMRLRAIDSSLKRERERRRGEIRK